MNRRTSYDRPGRCIFCGDGAAELTKEHILPKAIDGDMVIPKATCDICQKNVGKMEDRIHRRQLLGPRSYLGLKGHGSFRDKRKRFPLKVETVDGEGSVLVDREDHPAMLLFPRYSIPSWFEGIEEKPAFTSAPAVTTRFFNVDYDLLWRKYGILRPVVGQCLFDDWNRYLAKIAHCIAVAGFGVDGFVPLLHERILDERPLTRSLQHFVGCSPNPPPVEKGMHFIRVCELERAGVRYFYVDIQLFSLFDMPLYAVLTGLAPGTPVPAWARSLD